MSDNSRIVVLEGPLSEDLPAALGEAGWPVAQAEDAGDVPAKAEGAVLVVLDALAPGMDLEGCRRLAQSIEAPVLMVVPGLDTGEPVAALQAPVDAERLLQQVQELLTEPAAPHVVTVGDLVIDLDAWRVMVRGRRVTLSPTEFRVLAYLARNVGQTVMYETLLEAVWEYSSELGDPHLVTSCVYRLRRKLRGGATEPAYIVNTPGVGYRLRSQQQWEEAVRRRGR